MKNTGTIETQKTLVLKYLKTGRTMTNAKAVDLFNCWRLSSVINRLRKDGHKITTTLMGDSRYGSYKLVK